MRLLTCVWAVAALVLCVALVDAKAYATYPVLDETASWIAQRPVEVRCQTKYESENDPTIFFWGAEAYVNVAPEGGPEYYTVFRHGLCEQLLALHDGSWLGRYKARDVAWAVLVIAHESKHMRGGDVWTDEAITNCWAIRHVRYTALHLLAPFGLSVQLRDHAIMWFHRQPAPYNPSWCKLPVGAP